MIAPARFAAFECLLALSAGRADLATSLEQVRVRLDDARDRALVTEIATGVQRWRALLDHLITSASRRRLEQLDAEVLAILRLSAYQLLYLTRVPAAAVVDDAVNLVERSGKKSACGFVNAVLRSISRNRRALPLPSRPPSPSDRDAVLAYLSTTLSHPRWLVSRWLDRLGFEATERWLQFNNAPGALALRANTIRVTGDVLRARLAARGVNVTAGRYAPDAVLLDRGDRRAMSALDALEGQFVIQDEASQLVTLLAGPNPGDLLDTCAAPGGKTTALAAAEPNARIVACDLRDRRIELLRRTVTESGASNVRVVQADLLQPLPFGRSFNCVFVDAPCSGLGTIRRDPDLKWRRQESDLAGLARQQMLMLVHAAEAVRPGGRLIYATCSSEPEENEQVIRIFDERREFRRIDARTVHPALDASLVDVSGALYTSPVTHGLDAFYGVVFERTE
jgi:16S rRNA (cytosine967-C5)-methyltransferase